MTISSPQRIRRRRILAVLIILATILFIWRPWAARNRQTDASIAHPPQPIVANGPTESVISEGHTDAATSAPVVDRARLLGSWKDEFFGERTLTFHDDGSGLMVIKLDPVSRVLYGPELTFHFKWALTGDVMFLEMTGGEPKDAAESLSRFFGKTSERRIEQMDEHELHMRSLDSQKLYIHKRVETAEQKS